MFAQLFVLLYISHLLADYPLQTDDQAANKDAKGSHGWWANIAHASTHVVVSAFALTIGVFALGLPLTPAATVLGLAWIGGTHAVIDRRWPISWWMVRAGQREYLLNGGAAHIDHAAHATALGMAALVMASM
ncbi:DUF3307 domain-containing protein [Streptomyces griseocarneus]|uniref:DUF3307 domain-containing protein n=1 Tax=Streptomyces griseocarneus TaxID=51201 RepID=UPI00167C46D1|nr:DUF3307 domain-containing protein [Streptomyces griseocarneus]MBZ6473217.1 DUF3307 domain-containing protein [Streptomyces griseocarneus]GHG60503.1 hypothetical protein GCM10018779_27870 [Streptomyces griseocarneus]